MYGYRRIIGALFAMLTLVVTAVPTAAVDDAQVATTTTNVTQTFRLRLYGTAPRGDAMIVKYRTVAPNGTTSGAVVHVFCGDFRSALQDYPAKAACKGGGTTYSKSLSVPKGYSIVFSFERQKASNARDASTVFHKCSHKLDYNRLDRAWYRYGG
jgi:hypothetical protein